MINNKKEYDEWNNIKKETSVLKINIRLNTILALKIVSKKAPKKKHRKKAL